MDIVRHLKCRRTAFKRHLHSTYSVFFFIVSQSLISTFFFPAPHSPAPSSDRRELYKRPQQLFLDRDTPRSSFHFSSPSSGSPQSPQPSLPWESPKLRTQHSYMNPTASSMAKSSRSSSIGEDIQTETPPCSPSFSKSRRSCDDQEANTPLLSSSPVSSGTPLLSYPLSNSSSQTSSHPTAAVAPSRITQNIPPSRIPLPKQPLSPRRSLCLEVMPGGLARGSAPTTGPGCDVTGVPRSHGETTSLML